MSKKMKPSGIQNVTIPSEWDTARFRKIFSFGKGLNITKEDLVDEGIPVISYGQVHSKTNTGTAINDTLIRFVPEAYLRTGKQSLVRMGDLIFADTSEDLLGVGNCVFVDREGVLFAGYHSIITRPIAKGLYPKYFAYQFLTDFWRDQLRAKVMGVKVYSISQKLLRETSVIIPDSKEQKAIVDYLDAKCAKIDTVIADIEKQIDILQKYKKSLITETVTKGLDHSVPMKDSGIEWIGDIPEHWEAKRLKYVATVKTGPFGTQLSADEYSDEGIPIINVKNIGYGSILDDDLDHVPEMVADRLSVHRLKLNDIVFGRKGAVDKHAIITEEYVDWVQGSDCIRVRTTEDVHSGYLNYLFDSAYFSSYVMLFAVGTTMPSMNSEILLNARVLIPDFDEQCAIADYLDKQCTKLEGIISTKQKQLEIICQQKKSLIYEYVTGKKRVEVN